MTRTLIGTAKGPGERPSEFTFVAPDPDQSVRYGEYVSYDAEVDGDRREILGRVTRRLPIRLYPDTFMANPNVSPDSMGRLVGFDQRAHDLYEITATVLGYFEPAMGFVNPRVPPRPGEPIYIAADDTLGAVLGKRRPNEVGGVYIGSLLSRKEDAVPVVLDAARFTSTHLAIIASTGSGKSYLAGVMIEELMRPNNRAAVLIIDPHGEYHTLTDMQGDDHFAQDGYRPEVRVIRPDQIKVRVSSLELGDLRLLLPNLSEPMHYQLSLAYRRVTHMHQGRWTRDQLIAQVRSGSSNTPVTDPEDDQDMDPTARALIWRINSVLNGSIFHDHHNMPLTDLLRPGRCTVLQMNEIPEREQRTIVATLLRRLLRARMDTIRGLAGRGSEKYLPYPAFVLIEEAHTYAPANAEVVSTPVLKQILSEGRKFGVAIGLISQRPGKLDSDVLSQCMTQCIMRIVNPIDQARVAESVESVGRDLLDELPALTKGQVIVAGASVNTPILARVRRRHTRHGAEDPDSPQQWQHYFDQESIRQRARDNAPPADTLERRGDDALFLPV